MLKTHALMSAVRHLYSYFAAILLCLYLIWILSPCMPASADAEAYPNDSMTNALFFGDIDDPLPQNLTPPPLWQDGMQHTFNVLNIVSGIMEKCPARIFLVTDHIVFWCEELKYQEISGELRDRLRVFDSQDLPQMQKIFGWNSKGGADNDPRFHVLFTEQIGSGYNGYFSAADSADPRLVPSSNGMDLLFLSSSLLAQKPDAVIDTLSHELQHLIHYSFDENEMSFINEGFSGLSEYIALGYIRDTFIRAYLNDTGRSLIWWPESGNTQAYYGSSFLFSMYLYDRFGEDLIREAVSRPENGLNGLDQALNNCGIPYNADEVFQQWSAALLGQLVQESVRDWDYESYSFPQDGIYRDIRTLSCGVPETHEVAQYGLRFYNSGCTGPCQISLSGAAESSLTNMDIPGDEYAWWGGAVNNSLAVLSHDFDLKAVSGPVNFAYDVQYDIENGYDYYYLLLKDENGRIFRLAPSSATDLDPAGQNMGKGTTGISSGILHENIDLSPWAGKQIRLMFAYLTDTAGLSDGLLLDNFRLDAIGFHDDAETTDGGWESAGFIRIRKTVPQPFILMLLRPQPARNAVAEFYTINGGESFTVECPEGGCSFAVSAAGRTIRGRAVFTVLSESIVSP